MITPTTWFTPNRKEISYDVIDGEVILIHLKTGSYYSLEKSGAWIWSIIAAGTEYGRLLDTLNALFPGEKNMESLLHDFFEHLSSEGLIISPSEPTNGMSENESSEQKQSEPPATFTPPQLSVYTDMQALLLLDPIHEVDEAGWPSSQPVDINEASTAKEKSQARDS